MKKFAFILLTFASITIASAQHLTTRYGQTPNSNRTFTSVSLGYMSISDTLGATPDTLLIGGANYSENCFDRTYSLTLKDSCVVSWSSLANAWIGDRITFVIENGSVSGWVKFIGYSGLATKWSMTSGTTKISPTASHPWIATFTFDGTTWLQKSSAQD